MDTRSVRPNAEKAQMIVAFIIIAVFVGVSVLLATFASVVLIASGKLTLPNTNARREMRARVETAVAEQALMRERMILETENVVHERVSRALQRGKEEE